MTRYDCMDGRSFTSFTGHCRGLPSDVVIVAVFYSRTSLYVPGSKEFIGFPPRHLVSVVIHVLQN